MGRGCFNLPFSANISFATQKSSNVFNCQTFQALFLDFTQLVPQSAEYQSHWLAPSGCQASFGPIHPLCSHVFDLRRWFTSSSVEFQEIYIYIYITPRATACNNQFNLLFHSKIKQSRNQQQRHQGALCTSWDTIMAKAGMPERPNKGITIWLMTCEFWRLSKLVAGKTVNHELSLGTAILCLRCWLRLAQFPLRMWHAAILSHPMGWNFTVITYSA